MSGRVSVQNWPGSWIWPPHGRAVGAGLFHEPPQPHDPDRNGFIRYRGRFTLDQLPALATLWLCADGRYLAYLNGIRIGRGPAATDADAKEVDPWDVSALVTVGENVVALLVHAYGVDTAWYTRPTALAASGRGGGALYAHANLDGRIALDRIEDWRCARATEWRSDTPRVNDSLGFVEVRDARDEPTGWETVGFDDGGWARPEVCAPDQPALPGRTYFPVLRRRAVPLFVERTAAPRARRVDEVSDAARPEPGDILAWIQREPTAALERCEVRGDGDRLRIRTVAGRAVRVAYDFGELVAARPRIVVDGRAGVVVDLATAERVDGEGRPVGDLFGSRHGHRFVLRDGPQTLERWDWIGFRHLVLVVRGAAEPVALAADVVATVDPTPRLGEFACSDELLTAVWDAARRTIDLTVTDLIHSDVAREHRQWVSDARSTLGPILATIGDAPILRQALRQIAEAEPFASFLPMFAPGDYRAVGTTIPDFTLHWVLAVDEYLRWSGDAAFAASLYPVVRRSLRAFLPLLDDSGLVTTVPFWNFVDWAAVGRAGASGPVNGLHLLALDAAARIAAAAQDRPGTREYRARASQTRSTMRTRFRTGSGMFTDGPDGPLSQHTNALAILGGVATRRSAPRIAATIADLTRLRVTAMGRIAPAEDADGDYRADRHVVVAQPGFMGLVLRALAVAGRPDRALALVRHYWGPMTESGTCWETWSGRHSRCHPWATAPAAELPRIVLGAEPGAPGWTRVRIDPFTGDLAWARGRVPTPRGVIAVSWSRDARGMDLEVELPEGMAAELPGGERVSAGHQRRRIEVER